MFDITKDILAVDPDGFWFIVDKINDDVVRWVYENCADNAYQCCEEASWELYSRLREKFIELSGSMREFEKETNLPLRVAYGNVCGIMHVWVEIGDFIYDPTVMQFSSIGAGHDPFEPKETDYEVSDVEW